MEKIKEIGEIELIRQLAAILSSRADVTTGIGDDSAVVECADTAGIDFVLTSDAVISGTHFLMDTTPQKIGRKAIGRVLSDLAAMGAEPRWALVNLVAPQETSLATIKAIYTGMEKLAKQHNMAIVGGDTTESDRLALHVFAIGTVPRGTAAKRSTARSGDSLYVTGELGFSFETEHHLSFKPRVEEGLWLRSKVNAMMDVSDGLAIDLDRMLRASGCGARLQADSIPLRKYADTTHQAGLKHALHDGEDFELLFSISRDNETELMEQWHSFFTTKLTRIGAMTAKTGIIEWITAAGETETVPANGYIHFKTNRQV